ncbi:MAG: MarR family winged helix-turn-helix transcriptional regulator [Actinomycetota bacterium]
MRSDEPADAVDRIVGEWATVRPDLDVSPMAVVGRISRLARLIDQRLARNFAAEGIENWIYDVLATLRRIGPPHELSPTELVAHTMVTTGAMTNRIDRLIERGLVERDHDPDDRRRVIVRLTADGLALVDRVAPSHYELEHELLGPLDATEREALTTTLRTLLLHLGDDAT